MGKLCRYAFAAVACLLFVFLWPTAGDQDALRPWIAALTHAVPRSIDPHGGS